jgi:hypothetical protein
MTRVKETKSLSGESGEWKAGGRTVLFSAVGYGAGPILFLTTASVFIKPTMEATGWTTTEVGTEASAGWRG